MVHKPIGNCGCYVTLDRLKNNRGYTCVVKCHPDTALRIPCDFEPQIMCDMDMSLK